MEVDFFPWNPESALPTFIPRLTRDACETYVTCKPFILPTRRIRRRLIYIPTWRTTSCKYIYIESEPCILLMFCTQCVVTFVVQWDAHSPDISMNLDHEHPNSLRWLDWIFWGWYLPSLSVNYVGMSEDMEKRLPQLYYIKIKISYDLGFIAIGVAMAT